MDRKFGVSFSWRRAQQLLAIALLASCSSPAPFVARPPKSAPVRAPEPPRLHAKTDEELAALSNDDLDHELMGEVARFKSSRDFDAGYRPRVVKEAARRFSWKQEDVDRILRCEIWVGASVDQVFAAWGPPWRRSEQTSQSGTTYFWSYDANNVDLKGLRRTVAFKQNRATWFTEDE